MKAYQYKTKKIHFKTSRYTSVECASGGVSASADSCVDVVPGHHRRDKAKRPGSCVTEHITSSIPRGEQNEPAQCVSTLSS